MEQIVPKQYVDALIELKVKNLIKILTGFRQCGKSTTMMQFRDYLETQGVKD